VLTADIHEFVAAQYLCWNQHLLPEMRKQGVRLLAWKELGEKAREFARIFSARGRPASDADFD